jgi:hypothetical protein
MSGTARLDLDMSTSVLRWILRELVKNTGFFLKTFTSTYRFKVKTSNSNQFPISTHGADGSVLWVNRGSLNQGLTPSDLDGTLEDNRLRNPMQFKAMVRQSNLTSHSYGVYQDIDYDLEVIDQFDSRNERYQLEVAHINRGVVHHGRAVTLGKKILALSNRRSVVYLRSPSYVNSLSEKFKIFKTYMPHKSVEKAIYVGTSSNWFHFIVEGASRIVVIPREERMGIPIVLESNLHPNILELCSILTNCPPIQVPIGGSLEVKNLTLVREFGVYDPIGCNQRRDQLVEFSQIVTSNIVNDPTLIKRKLYLRRARNLYRPLQNERDVETLLHSSGFTSLYPENHSLSEFINIIRNAEIVIAESGAAITNLMFAKPGTKFVELLPAVGLAGFWQEFVEIFEIQYSSIRGTSFKFGSKGYAFDGYKISLSELSKNVN